MLAHAIALGRAVLTLNRRDYIRLHKKSPKHAGIVVCTHNPDANALANGIHDAIAKTSDLNEQLFRITRS